MKLRWFFWLALAMLICLLLLNPATMWTGYVYRNGNFLVGVKRGHIFIACASRTQYGHLPTWHLPAEGFSTIGNDSDRAAFLLRWWPDLPTNVQPPLKGIVVRFWLLGAAIVLFISWAVWRSGSFAETHCQTCGYSLTGNTSGVCPECGTAVQRLNGKETA